MITARHFLFAAGLGFAGSLGCGGSVTELVVVVDSDLPVPGQLDELRIDVDGVVGGPVTSRAPLSGVGAATLPGTVGVVHESGPFGPVTVTAAGFLRGTRVVSQVARTSFVAGRTLVLRLHLLRSCRGTTCPMDQTCGATGCQSIDVAAASLPDYAAGGLDAAAPPTDSATPPTDAGGPPVDAGSPPTDAGTPTDAGNSCDTRYGAGMGYELCSSTATTCTIAATTAGGSCNDFCTSFGGTCISAQQNGTAPPFCTSTGADTCAANRTSNICVCSR